MGRRNRNGFAWTTRDDESLTAVTPIGNYRIERGGGHSVVSAYFKRRGNDDEETLGRFASPERARLRCQAHYNEMKNFLKPLAA